jgi:hypothetical protein
MRLAPMLILLAVLGPALAVADEYVHLILGEKMHLYESATSETPIGEVLQGEFYVDLKVYEERNGRFRVRIDEMDGETWVDANQVKVRQSIAGLGSVGPEPAGQPGIKVRLY